MNRIHLASALAAVALIPGALQAQTITACYVPKTGSVYRIQAAGAPAACKSTSHVEFSWDAGQSLPTAPQEVVKLSLIQPGDDAFVTAACPAGTEAFSGAFRLIPPATDVVFLLSSKSTVPVGWVVRVRNEGTIAAEIAAHAFCSTYAP